MRTFSINVYVVLLLGLLSLQSLAINETLSGPYNENIFIISNYSGVDATLQELRSVRNLLDSGKIDGFRFYLEWGKQQNQVLLRKPGEVSAPFVETMSEIKEYLGEHPEKILSLFLDFDFNVNEIESVFHKSGIDEYLYVHDANMGWPDLKNMADQNSRLVVFSMQEHSNAPDWLLYVWNYAAEPYPLLLESPDVKGEFLRGNPKNSLLIFNDYNLPHGTNNPGNSGNVLSLNPYLIEYIRNIWTATGKMPSFIVLDRFEEWIIDLRSQLCSFKVIKGTVSFNALVLDQVSWIGINSLTYGKYSFPIGPGNTITLTPKCPGYRFKPESVAFEETKKNIDQHFIAIPLELNENLEAYYPFDNNVKDKSSNSHHAENKGVTFTEDSIRSTVAYFDNNSYIVLPKSEEINIRDHDFTIAAWVKVKKYLPDREDCCIIGTTTNSYQQGIHLLLRKRKPYFGFFFNDLEGNTKIEEGKWYHLVWRYNKENGEQAIFVNGELDSKSLGHPSFKGRENLLLGITGFDWKTNMYGEIDDLAIWSRALGKDEIWGIPNGVYNIIPGNSFFKRYPLRSISIAALIILCIVLCASLIYLWITRRRVISAEEIREIDLNNVHAPKKNYIRLFGKFKVLDAEGNDITPHFTPKIKQLFLLILLHSQTNRNGISTNELTSVLWAGQSYQGAKNSRGVTIRKLRLLLDTINKIEILFNVDRWYMEFSGDVYCDYIEYLKILDNKDKDTPDYYQDIYRIVKGGAIFKDETYDWLDDFKGNVGNNIVDMLLKVLEQLDMEKDNKLVVKISDRIFETDPVNEQALAFKLSALIKQNNRNTAKYTYDKFCSLYHEYYDEEFAARMDDLIL